MKTYCFVILITFFVNSNLFSQTYSKTNIKQVTFTVHGNCDKCKKRIEEAAKSVKGVKTAKWDQEYQIITVTYDVLTTKEIKIHKAIAASGHDTDKEKAEDKAYKALPECCHYRKKNKIK